ncbi:Uncharacterized protein PECH_002351 [Penicillium ucsense]|uniref:Uncharacterized protein n=1 Tax=Penicillium ucsense TaxID=2839758 RepID=A0A8J8WFU6_9EURO|nr:Uncharacterized protein PECM_001940 [Penicillium ucsense]KAF7730934.1 Uncharacterized protein PECH_002351 [Penicillium ucsense]
MQLLDQFLQLRYELIGNLTAWVNGTYFIPPDAMASILDRHIQDIAHYQGLGDIYFYLKCNQVRQILLFASHELRVKRKLTRDACRAMNEAVVCLRQLQIS